MKKTLKLFGIIALVAVIGFSMAACGGDDDNGGGGGGGGGGTASVITVTNIPAEYNGKYIRVEIRTGEYSSLRGLGNEAKFTSYTAMKSKVIAGTTVTLNTFEYVSVSVGYDKYTGNVTVDTNTFDGSGNKNSVSVDIGDDDTGLGHTWRYNAGPVTLTNGSTTLDYSTLVATDDR